MNAFMLYEAKSFQGYTLCSRDGEIGKVKDFYFDDSNWKIRYLVADTGKWLRGRQVLISPQSLLGVDKQEKCISVNLTKKQIENSPPLASDKPISRQFEREFLGYYELPLFFMNDPHKRGIIYPPPLDKEPDEADIERKSWDPHLRSAHDAGGFLIEASNRAVGCLVDLIVDDQDWSVRYVVVDAQSWWPETKVLIALQWVTRVNWSMSKLFVDMACETFRQSPAYTGEAMLTRDYENKLFQNCGRKGYWVDTPAK